MSANIVKWALMVALVATLLASAAWAGLVGPEIAVSDGGSWWPTVSYNSYSDRYLAVWNDLSAGTQLRARCVDPATGSLLDSEFAVSPLRCAAPSLAVNISNHEWFLVFGTDADIGCDIMAQRIFSGGSLVGGVITISAETDCQWKPWVDYDPDNDRYLVVWQDSRGSCVNHHGVTIQQVDVRGRFFTPAGSPIGSEFKITDSSPYNKTIPRVVYNPVVKEFLVIWSDYRNWPDDGSNNNDWGDVYGQRINATTRALIGGNIAIYWGGDPYVPNGLKLPEILCNPTDGSYLLSITRLISIGWIAEAIILNTDTTWRTGLINVTYPNKGAWAGAAWIPTDNTFYITFIDSDYDLSGRHFTASGLPLNGPTKVLYKQDADQINFGSLACRTSDGQCLQVSARFNPYYECIAQRLYADPDTTPPALVNPFRAYQQTSSSVLLTWANPPDADFIGTMVRYRTDAYPASTSDGNLLCEKAALPSSSDSFTHSVAVGQSFYYSAFTYDATGHYSAGANVRPSRVWLNDVFDSYNDGSLAGQGGWTRAPDVNSCAVQSAVRAGSSGRAVDILGTDVYDDSSIANFGSISGGYQVVSFDTCRDKAPYAPQDTQAILDIQGSGLLLTRMEWGTSFRILTGSGTTYTDLVTCPAAGRWYHVEIGLNLTSKTVDAWVNGVQKVSNKALYESTSVIDSINLTGYNAATAHTYLDNLKGEQMPAGVVPAAPTISVPAIGADVGTPYPRIVWFGEPHTYFEVHIGVTDNPTDGSVFDSGSITSGSNAYEVGPLASGGNYYVFVRLRNSTGWSGWSAAGNWFRVIDDTVAPGSPSGFCAQGTNSAVRLSWSNPVDADLAGVMVRFSVTGCPATPSDGFLAVMLDSDTPGAAASWTHTGLTNGVKYYYSLFAFDDARQYSPPATDGASPENWNVEYLADLLPSVSSPAWSMLADGGSESYSHIEPSGGLLHVLDNSTGSGSKIRWYGLWGMSTGATVVTRARCDSAAFGAYSSNVTLCDGTRYINFVILPDTVAAKADGATVLDREYALDGAQFHKYRFTLQGGSYACYVDENPVPVFAGMTSHPTADNRICFGVNGSSSTQSIYYDYLLYRTDAAAAPAGAPTSILDTKLSPNNAVLTVPANVVSAAFSGYFYIQSADGLHGLRVNRLSHTLKVGQVVDVTGAMATNAEGERYLDATSASAVGTGSPRRIGMLSTALGGSDLSWDPMTGAGQRGPEGGMGPNNVGMLVRVWGKVTGIDPARQYFWIDSGCGPVKLLSGALVEPLNGHYAIVTGISTLDISTGAVRSVVRPRVQSDMLDLN